MKAKTRHHLRHELPALLVTHPIFRHPGFGRHHPLSTRRQGAVLDVCDILGWAEPTRVRQAPVAERPVLERFHSPNYLDALERTAAAGVATGEDRQRYNLGTMECPVFDDMMIRIGASVGGSILAAELALAGRIVFHPGGGTHHGRPDRASGFCFSNDPVFAILRLLDGGASRVAYIDLDAHHGDGVEDALASDERVMLVSIHEEGRWPGTGALGASHGGRVCNLAVPRGLTDIELGALSDRVVLPHLQAFRPDAVVVTLGADGHAGDPLSAMRLTNAGLWRAAEACCNAAPAAVVLGGGGYNPWTTARLWTGFWGRIAGFDFPDGLPKAAKDVLAGLTCDLIDEEDMEHAWTTSLCDPVLQHGSDEIRQSILDICGLLTAHPANSAL